MPTDLKTAFAEALNKPGTDTIVATSDEDGTPHLEHTTLLEIDGDGRLVLLELNEYAQTNRNLVRAIWFGKRVTVYLKAGAQHLVWRGKPYKAIISGARFESYYQQIRQRFPDAQLSTAWLIDLEQITDESATARRAREDEGRLPLVHLDRIAKPAPVGI